MTSESRLTFTLTEIERQQSSGSIRSPSPAISVSARELRKIERLLVEDQEAFLKAWDEYFGA
jgi:hypothetical protein